MHDLKTTDLWDKELGRLAREATVMSLAMLAALGRLDGARLAEQAIPVVGELFVLRFVTGIKASGGMHGAAALLRDVPDISPPFAKVLSRLAAGVTGPDPAARNWLQQNGARLERAYRTARLAHMVGTALKMNAAETFNELRRVARRPELRGCAGTSEDVAVSVMSARAHDAAP